MKWKYLLQLPNFLTKRKLKRKTKNLEESLIFSHAYIAYELQHLLPFTSLWLKKLVTFFPNKFHFNSRFAVLFKFEK